MPKYCHSSKTARHCLPCFQRCPALPAGPAAPPRTRFPRVPTAGFPLRNDNLTNFGYVGNGDGQSTPEQYNAFHADDPSNSDPIMPGMTTYFRWVAPAAGSAERLVCLLAADGNQMLLPCRHSPLLCRNVETGKFCRLAAVPAQLALQLGAPKACATQSMLCDLNSPADATVFTYTGAGLKYNGVPLVQTPSRTLVLSSDPACSIPGGDQMGFPPAALARKLPASRC